MYTSNELSKSQTSPALPLNLGRNHLANASLTKAASIQGAFVVLEGDYGGQTYAVFLASRVKCSEPLLHELLYDIDALHWNNRDGAQLSYFCFSVGEIMGGGMGGGIARKSGWTHPDLRKGVGRRIRAVLNGDRLYL
ncbi:hypothetical protein [Psychromicrobium lacuslunae]|uniref:Uncharacterized protein n=1 Tax=Psychromicrobium lacuslunae TaxID=1618207 RepID=A0A0D4BWZ8_9MICC|nr:hypothetical protein [Psychromicrobium lacuslunae]AJT40626.1 hypothetical protein UM93_02090 [Psychromicrobium lacuslunae]